MRRTRPRPPARRGGRAARPAVRPRAAPAACARLPRPARRALVRAARSPRPAAGPRPRQPNLGEERSCGLGLAGERAQDVERVHVAGSFPDRVERALAEEARQLRLLDEAVAAQALERLGDERRRALADPELGDRGREAPERGRPPRRRRGRGGARVTVAASDSTHRSASTFRIRGCSASMRPKADRCAAWWVASATARRIRAVEPSTQSSRVWLTISRIVWRPRPSAPTRLGRRRRRARSRPRRWSGCRACPSAARSGSPACGRSTRKQESPAGACASTRKASRHRRRAEPLVAVEDPGVPFAARCRLVRAYVGTTLALGHRHAAERVAARQSRDPLLGEIGLRA